MKTKLYIILSLFVACILSAKASTVTVGTNTTSSTYVGSGPNHNYYGSQILYDATAINQSGYISKIAYQVGTPATTTSSGILYVYMAEVDDATWSTDEMFTQASQMSSVYSSYSYSFGQSTDGWEEITLTTPFYYSGKKNLVVAVTSSKTTPVSVTYRCTRTTSADHGIRSYSNTTSSYSAFNQSGMTSSAYVPVTRFTFSELEVSATVGKSTTTSNQTAWGELYNYFGSQIMYSPDEVGQVGDIKEIAFLPSGSFSSYSSTINIWMGVTSNSTLTTSNKLNSSQMENVFSGLVTLQKDADGYVSVVFDKPFHYDGTKNLVVGISSSKTWKNISYQCMEISGRSVRCADDNNSSFSSPFYSGMANTNYVPVTRFKFNIGKSCNLLQISRDKGTSSESKTGLCPYWKYYSAQYLYPVEEMAFSGIITSLGFDVAETPASVSCAIKIYLAETDAPTLNTSNPLTEDKMTLVYEGTVKLGSSTGYQMISFNKQNFCYYGLKNLVVAVSSSNPDAMPLIKYKCATGVSNRGVCKASDTDVSYADPFLFGSSLSNQNTIPNIRFYTRNHSVTTGCTPGGVYLCKNCGLVLPYAFQSPDLLANGIYGISTVAQLRNVSRLISWKGTASNSYYLMDDLDLSGVTEWIPMGTNLSPMTNVKLRGYNYINKVGHTISGLSTDQYLIGRLGEGSLIEAIRLDGGKLIKAGDAGTVRQCLTLGNSLFNSKTAICVCQNSYYLSDKNTTDGGCDLDKMKSGEVTYLLNSLNATTGVKGWYQTLGTDSYPVYNTSHSSVYHYNECEVDYYTNDQTKSGLTIAHTLVNSCCSKCNGQPAIIYEDVTLDDTKSYDRTVEGQVADGYALRYSRNFTGLSVQNKWQPLYIPFEARYTEADTEYFDLAELHTYGVMEDTNGDGIVNSQDEKVVVAALMNIDSKIEPNTPYLIRPKKAIFVSLFSVDGKLYSADDKVSVSFSTMKEQFTASGTYQSQSKLGLLPTLGLSGGKFVAITSLAPFRWKLMPSYKRSKEWDQFNIAIATDYYFFNLYDDEKSNYTRSQTVQVDNFTYTRNFSARQVGKWQSMYVPFDVKVTDDLLAQADVATIEGVESKGDADFIVVAKKEAGTIINANTPFVIRVKSDEDLVLDYASVELKKAISTSVNYSSAHHDYTFTGVYETYQNGSSPWYALAKSDGLFHPATVTAKLPAYRFYLTVDGGQKLASELRLAFMEAEEIEEEQTGIHSVPSRASESASFLYTLDGRRVSQAPARGSVYIRNGKIVLDK